VPRRSVGLFSNRNFIILLGGQTVSVLGDFFGLAALSVVTLELTGSGLGVAVNWIIFFVPRSVMRLLGGPLVDRWDRRTIMIATETSRGGLFALLVYAALSGALSPLLVYGVSALVGLLGALFQMSSDAVLPSIVEKDELVRANSYFGSSVQVAMVVGWALAGISITAYGISFALTVDSASFFVLVIALLFVRIPPPEYVLKLRGAFIERLREGFGFFKERKELLWLSLYFACINFFISPFWNVYLLLFSNESIRAGPVGFGLLNAVETLGLALGSATMGRIGFVRRRRTYLLLSMLLAGGGIVAFDYTMNLAASLIAASFIGFVIPFANIVEIAIFQELVPNQMRGRVFGLKDFFSFVATPAGLLMGGLLSGLVPLHYAILVSGVGIAAIALGYLLLVPAFKRLDVRGAP
jgi:MFS family permease